MAEHNEKGKLAEKFACDYLQKNNYFIVERNWRWRRAEVDIIAWKSPILVFAEVKYRRDETWGSPAEFVKEKKQRFMIDAANRYIEEKKYAGEIRFDILSVTEDSYFGLKIEHFEDAFWPGLG